MPTIGVIIRADHTDQATIECLVNRLERQQGVSFEIVLVDSSPPGQPLHVRPRELLRVVKLDRRDFAFGRALNVGCRAATADILVTLNGHTIPIGSSWLKDLTEPLADPGIAGTCGMQNGEWQTGRSLDPTLLTMENFGPPDWKGLSTANLAFRRDVWERFPFDEEIPYAEDKEWGHRVTLAGLKILVGVEATIHHMHRDRPLKRELWYVKMTGRSPLLYAHVPGENGTLLQLMSAWVKAWETGVKTVSRSMRVALARYRTVREVRRAGSGALERSGPRRATGIPDDQRTPRTRVP